MKSTLFPLPALLCYLHGICGIVGMVMMVPIMTDDARAQESPWVHSEQAQVRLLSMQRSHLGQDIVLGLEFRLAPGWKTYWRSPGATGYPLRLDRQGSQNIDSLTVSWPAPKRFFLLGQEMAGYADRVIFPLKVTPRQADTAVIVRLLVEYLVCEKVCIPLKSDLHLTIPPAEGNIQQLGEHAHAINQFMASVPGTKNAFGLKIEAAHLVDTEEASAVLTVKVRSHSSRTLGAADIFVEYPAVPTGQETTSGIAFGKPEKILFQGGKQALFRIPIHGPPNTPLPQVGEDFRITLSDEIRFNEAIVRATTGQVRESASTIVSLWGMMIVAFLGGLILNVMPCVLPVLSIKLVSILQHGDKNRTRLRHNFLASAAGIMTCFMVLAGVLALLKQAGISIGWGIQFQQPLFLGIMMGVIVLFIANLLGYFEIKIPSVLLNNRFFPPAPKGRVGGYDLGHSFLSGILATLLSTPCTAPFIGTAVGFALSGTHMDIFLIYACMGLGLASPWLLVAAFPASVGFLPKPGAWMVTVRRVMAVLLGLTVLWLASVLMGINGVEAAVLAIMGCLLGLIVLKYRSDLLVALLFLFLMGGGVHAINTFPLSPRLVAVSGADYWRPYEETAVQDAIEQGTVVIIDVTADWCITCIANKTFAFDDDAVADAMAAYSVQAFRRDWTRPDPAIAAWLASYGRYGIPFDIVFGPGAPEGIILSEILTPDDVLSAIRQAAGGSS